MGMSRTRIWRIDADAGRLQKLFDHFAQHFRMRELREMPAAFDFGAGDVRQSGPQDLFAGLADEWIVFAANQHHGLPNRREHGPKRHALEEATGAPRPLGFRAPAPHKKDP